MPADTSHAPQQRGRRTPGPSVAATAQARALVSFTRGHALRGRHRWASRTCIQRFACRSAEIATDALVATSAARRDVGPLVVVADDAEDVQIRESRAASASDWPRCAPCFASSAGKRAMRPASRGNRARASQRISRTRANRRPQRERARARWSQSTNPAGGLAARDGTIAGAHHGRRRGVSRAAERQLTPDGRSRAPRSACSSLRTRSWPTTALTIASTLRRRRASPLLWQRSSTPTAPPLACALPRKRAHDSRVEAAEQRHRSRLATCARNTIVERPRGRGHLIAWVCLAQREGCGVHAKDASPVCRGVPS